jgi:hypothetical protein
MTGRHFTTAVTLLVLCGLLVVGAVVGVKTMLSPIPGSDATAGAAPSPTCTTTNVKKGQRLRSRQVTVSVFNAGTTVGLAQSTLRALHRRGFRRGETGNAPSSAKVRFVQVWTTEKNDATARLVARQFGRHTLVKVTRKNLGEGVDVVVGDSFRGLKKAPLHITVRTRQQVCLPTGS